MKPGDTVRINSKYSMPIHATVLRIRDRKVRVSARWKYWIAMAMLTFLSGCTPHHAHKIWDGYEIRDGWATKANPAPATPPNRRPNHERL